MYKDIYKGCRAIMFLSPELLLSSAAREHCVARLRKLPQFTINDTGKKHAAVLVPLCIVDNEVCLLYTLRSHKLSAHSGQVSFPGGKMDKGETVFETALRETEEEIGFSPKNVDVWTKMSLMQGRDPSVVITPVVGFLKDFDMSQLQSNESEVAEIFTIPMKVFCNKENHACLKYKHITIPVFNGGKHRVWGITGLITHLFLQSFLPKEVYQVEFSQKEYTIEELLPSKL